jgi:signal transduction histidine kinase
MGLGLTISRLIISQLGGEVGLKSKFGEGSTFSISIPIERFVQSAETNNSQAQLNGLSEP